MSERELDDSSHREKVPPADNARPSLEEQSPRRSRRGRRKVEGLGISPLELDKEKITTESVAQTIKKLSLDESSNNEGDNDEVIEETPSAQPEQIHHGKRSGRSRRVVERHPTGDESDLIALAQFAQKAKQNDNRK